MDSIPLEMDNIFDNYDDDDDIAIPTRLPDLDEMEADLQPMTDRQEDDEQNADGNEEDATDNPELLAKLKGMKGASKHAARKTFPKLDATRLTGERGIPVLPKIFKDVYLKGKNHEVEDLKVIMHHLEHWAHRLFPKMPFPEVLERVERLGAKKEVQTCVKRIRLGMQVLPTDEVEEDEVQRLGDDAPENDDNGMPDEDEIEDLIREQEELDRQSSQAETTPGFEAVQSQALSQQVDETPSQSQTLPNDVKARIERNKRLAMEKRAARLGKALDKDSSHQVDSQVSSEENGSQAATEARLDVSSSQDAQTFDSAMDMLDSEDVTTENPNEETDMTTERLPLPEDGDSGSQNKTKDHVEKTSSQENDGQDKLDIGSQGSDDEICLSLPGIDKHGAVNESHESV